VTPGSPGHIPLASANDVPDGGVRLIETGGVAVTVCRDGDRWYAVDDACPHRGLSLSTATLDGGVLTCSWHGYRFNLASGACLDSDVPPLTCHRLLVDDEGVWLETR
jgi:nitrite reductase (NADH) small subunit/3-phenylpropionate/trans-cinnamate dioxygenase ferredoxin subunit